MMKFLVPFGNLVPSQKFREEKGRGRSSSFPSLDSTTRKRNQQRGMGGKAYRIDSAAK